MKLPTVSRPLFAALCGVSLVALPAAVTAQDRPREDRPVEGQRPPRGEFRLGENPRGEVRPTETRRDDAPRGERGEPRPADRERGEVRPAEGQRGQPQGQFNPQELFRDLNDDQRATLRSFFEANQGAMRENAEKSMRLRREIGESAMADKPNEGLIRDKIMEAAKLEADATIARARAFAQVREKLPKQTIEQLRGMIANMGPRPGQQGPMQGGQDVRRPAGENFNQPGRGVPEGQPRRPDVQREGDRRPETTDRKPVVGGDRRPEGREGEQLRKPAGEGDRRPEATDRKPAAGGDRGPRPDGDRGPRVDGDRGPRPDGDRGRNPEGGDRRPEPPRRPPADQ